MSRQARSAHGGVAYHLLNRASGRLKLFRDRNDYNAFLTLLEEALERVDLEMFGYCLMPDHWHMIVRPRGDGDLEQFMRWIGTTHVRRHHSLHDTRGAGHLYQGRYKSFPIQEDRHLLTALRYVEANPLRAKKVKRAQAWEWSSLHARSLDKPPFKLAAWPVRRPNQWAELVNQPIEKETLLQLRTSVFRGRPFGEARWVDRAVDQMGLRHTVRAIGRPRKATDEG